MALKHVRQLWFALVVACSSPGLEVRGELQRIVGEPLEVELVSGEGDLSGAFDLVDAAGEVFTRQRLEGAGSGSQVSLVVPAGVAVGPATLRLAQHGAGRAYRVALGISRLAVALTTNGRLLVASEPGSPIEPLPGRADRLGAGGGRLAMSPTGGLLVTLSEPDRHGESVLTAFEMTSRKLRQVGAAVTVVGAKDIAATEAGAMVGTTSGVSLFSFAGGVGAKLERSFALSAVTAVAVDRALERGVVLRQCDADSDGMPDADCLSVLDLSAGVAADPPTIVDASADGLQVALSQDGAVALVVDPSNIHAVLLDRAPRLVRGTPWPQAPASPINVARTTSDLGHLFAVGDANSGLVWVLGLDATDDQRLKPVSTVRWPGQSGLRALGFGRRTDLYLAAGTELLRGVLRTPETSAERIAAYPEGQLAMLVVQP